MPSLLSHARHHLCQCDIVIHVTESGILDDCNGNYMSDTSRSLRGNGKTQPAL